MSNTLELAVTTIEALKKGHSALHRRCQAAEGAVAEFMAQWKKHGRVKAADGMMVPQSWKYRASDAIDANDDVQFKFNYCPECGRLLP
ncbi:MAG: hypothetical protein KJ579_04940 [Verrucomicrobia bacterium]|nr:hypothetical protein [Verrucomicrobiota bacterium]